MAMPIHTEAVLPTRLPLHSIAAWDVSSLRNRSMQGCLPQAKSSGIERYRSELSPSKPSNLLPNRHSPRLHSTVTIAATQTHHYHR
jgi:hypothetical protein